MLAIALSWCNMVPVFGTIGTSHVSLDCHYPALVTAFAVTVLTHRAIALAAMIVVFDAPPVLIFPSSRSWEMGCNLDSSTPVLEIEFEKMSEEKNEPSGKYSLVSDLKRSYNTAT